MGVEMLSVLLAPLTPSTAVLFLAVGLYSLWFNAGDARRRNHPRAAKAARAGGWFYVAAGAAVLLRMLF